MAKWYRHPNGRLQIRGGRFKRATLKDVFGVEANNRIMICEGCGKEWMPLIVSGRCSQCNQTGTPKPPPEITPEIQAKIDEYIIIRPQRGFIDPFNIRRVTQLERELKPWLDAGMVYKK